MSKVCSLSKPTVEVAAAFLAMGWVVTGNACGLAGGNPENQIIIPQPSERHVGHVSQRLIPATASKHHGGLAHPLKCHAVSLKECIEGQGTAVVSFLVIS
jgi:hypothetical protein